LVILFTVSFSFVKNVVAEEDACGITGFNDPLICGSSSGGGESDWYSVRVWDIDQSKTLKGIY